MKRADKAVRATAYLAGFLAIGAALLLTVMLVLSLLGLLHPRKTQLTLYTKNVGKIYDGVAAENGALYIDRGSLRAGHRIEIRAWPTFERVGIYENAPEFVVVDETGADVSEQYDIKSDFGEIVIQPRPIHIVSPGKVKVYDGELLKVEDVWLDGTLAPGDQLITESGTVLLEPGTQQARVAYRIVTESGEDVTDQYEVVEILGKLTVLPIQLTITTESATKYYNGTPLTQPAWKVTKGAVMTGHTLQVQMSAQLDDVGTLENTAQIQVVDEAGRDVTRLYDIVCERGTLEMRPNQLRIATGSSTKIYDGQSLSCAKWELTEGRLRNGEKLLVVDAARLDQVGSIDNVLRFQVVDESGQDVTYRYEIACDYGTLQMQPRVIAVRTGSAKKVYDGTELCCNDCEIISGELCGGEQIEIICTSITQVGKSENYVLDCTVYRVMEDGTRIDVTSNYRIVFAFGVLEITAP